jgi:hypothetical protein
LGPLICPWNWPRKKHHFQQFLHCCVGTLLSNGSGTFVFTQPLPTNGCFSGSSCEALCHKILNYVKVGYDAI